MRTPSSLMGAALGRLRSRPSSGTSPFDLFYSGQHDALIDLFGTRPMDAWSADDLHLVAASMTALGVDPALIFEAVPAPLSRGEFVERLRTELSEEVRNPTRGLLHQPRFVHKSLFAAGLGLQADKAHFVETGTYIGQSLFMISGMFESLWSVEASPLLHTAAAQLFANRGIGNVNLSLGDSRDFLGALPDHVIADAVFFLDAHYSSGITSREYGACPVIEEIDIILTRCPGALVVVDDLRTMSGRDGYPTLEDVLNSIPHTLDVRIAFDQLIIGPSSLPGLAGVDNGW